MKKNRTDYTFYYKFTNPEEDFSEECLVHAPFDIFMKVMHDFCLANYGVNIDGTDNSVWNLFCNTNLFDDLMEDEDFIFDLSSAYEHSPYFEEDEEEWLSLEPWRVD